MKKFGVGSVIMWFAIICAIIIAIPTVINISCEMLNTYTTLQFEWRLEWSTWCDIIAVAIPSALTCFVIKQSEVQQKASDKNQERMERINQRMLQLELKSRIGYMVPELYNQIGTDNTRTVLYKHNLKRSICLKNIGDDDVFVISATVRANEREHFDSTNRPLYVSKHALYNDFCIDLQLSELELKQNQVDAEIELNLRNTKGYTYKQVLYIGFENQDGVGIINKFNTEIKEIEENAH